MLKDWITPLVRPLPQWSPVAIAPPAQAVVATLRWDGQSVDVTQDHTVASLKPLTIATSLDAGRRPVLEYRDRATRGLLGVLQLVQIATIAADNTSLVLYYVAAGEHHCLAWPRRSWNAWLQNRSMARHRPAHQSAAEPSAIQRLMIAYLCPRPVVLVSVGEPGHQNIFPMDLIGPLERSGLFSLALRTTNVSEPVMRQARRVVLSHMPASMKATVYQLSEHHRQPLAEWGALPFPMRPSRQFGIPAVAAALRIQELDIVHSQEIGSHTFFVARVIADDNWAQGAQLHHTAGFHQAYRRGQDMPFAEV